MNEIGYTNDEAWKALRIAAEETYKSEVLDTEMEELLIGMDNEYYDKEDWTSTKVSEWLERAKNVST